MNSYSAVSAVLLLSTGLGYGQTASLALSSGSGAPGSAVTLPVSFSASTAQITALQWTFAYSPSDFSAITVNGGPAATAAGKSVSCSGPPGSYTCIVFGLNTTALASGVLATVTVTVAPAAAPVSPIQMNSPVAAAADGSAVPLSAGSGSVTVPQLLRPTSLSCSPGTINAPGTSSCTVTLSGAAPAGGAAVALASNYPSLAVPGSVTVAAGSVSGSFIATAGSISAGSSATVTATLNGSSQSFTLSLAAPGPAAVSSLSCTPASLSPGASTTCTITLTGTAGQGGTAVSVSSNHAALPAPASVTVPAGSITAWFTATAALVPASASAVITASLNGGSRSFALILASSSNGLSIACQAGTLPPGASTLCTVTVSQPAGPGSLQIALASNHPSLVVPEAVSIPQGGTSAQFTATAGFISAPGPATITATAGSLTGNVTLTISHLNSLVSLRCIPATISTPGQSTCIVFATAPAPSEGWRVSLVSDNASLTVPASVTIPSGSNSVAFPVTAAAVSAETAATVTAELNSATQEFTLTLASAGAVTSLGCDPATLPSGAITLCTVALSKAAGPGGATIALSSSEAALVVPASVTVNAGLTSATFQATAGYVDSTRSVMISAALGEAARTFTLTIQRSSQTDRLNCSPAAVHTPASASCTVRLLKPAPEGGSAVKLTSSHRKLSVPASITVPAGATTATFLAKAAPVTTDIGAVLTATADGETLRFALWLTGTRPTALACAPKTVPAGGRADCEIQLSSGESGDPITLTVASSSGQAIVPETVASRPGQASLSFQALINPAARQQSITLTVTYEDVSVRDTITVQPAAAPVLTVPGRQVVAVSNRLQFSVSAIDPGGLPVVLSASRLPDGASFDAATGRLEWTPRAAQLGSHVIAFAATNTLNAAATREVTVEVVSGKATITAVVNAASYSREAVCSPGAVAGIFGSGFTAAPPQGISQMRAPTQLNGVRVKVNQDHAPVLYVSDTQVNFLCPPAEPGSRLEVVVENATDVSAPVEIGTHFATPGIFTLDGSGSGQGAILLAGSAIVAMPRNGLMASQPSQPGDYVSIFASGLGPVESGPGWGEAASLELLAAVRAPVTVLIGGVPAEVVFAGLAPGAIGLYQVNVRVPASALIGDAVPVTISVTDASGQALTSNTVTMAIEPRRP